MSLILTASHRTKQHRLPGYNPVNHMTLKETCDFIETLLEAKPMTEAERVYWLGWLRTLVSLGSAKIIIAQQRARDDDGRMREEFEAQHRRLDALRQRVP